MFNLVLYNRMFVNRYLPVFYHHTVDLYYSYSMMETLSFLSCFPLFLVMHLSMSSPRGGGGRATHGNLTVACIPRVGILIGHHAFDLSILYSRREVNHLSLLCLSFSHGGGDFDNFFLENVKIPTLCPIPPPGLDTSLLAEALYGRKETLFSRQRTPGKEPLLAGKLDTDRCITSLPVLSCPCSLSSSLFSASPRPIFSVPS